MLMTKERQAATRTWRGWAINVLREAGAIHECKEHGRAKDRADPHAYERAFKIARQDRPSWISLDEAITDGPRHTGFRRRYLPRVSAARLSAP